MPTEPDRESGTSALATCLSVIKCVVGAGSFFLPYGFKEGGLWASIIGVLVIGILCDYINVRVIQSKRILLPGKRKVTYAALMQATFGFWGGVLLAISIVAQALGVCAIYSVFSADMLHSLKSEVTIIEWIAMITLLEIFLSWFKSFAWIGYTSFIGDIAVTLGIIVVLVYGFKDGGVADPIGDYPGIQVKSFPKFFATAAFLFAITMILFPIEDSMKKPKHFYGAMHIAFFLTTCMNAAFGALGYLFFADKTEGIVIANLDASVFVTLAKVALVVDLIFTYVVVFVPARDIAEGALLKRKVWRRAVYPLNQAIDKCWTPISRKIDACEMRVKRTFTREEKQELIPAADHEYEKVASVNGFEDLNGDHDDPTDEVFHWERVLVRTGLIILIGGLGMAVPNVIDLVGLFMGVTGSLNSFILPMMIYLRVTYWQDRGQLPQSDSIPDYAKDHEVGNGDRGFHVTGLQSSHDVVVVYYTPAQRAWRFLKSFTHWTVHLGLIVLGIVAGVAATTEAFITIIQDGRDGKFTYN